jgi:DNA-binding PadR family transcriptional regulator
MSGCNDDFGAFWGAWGGPWAWKSGAKRGPRGRGRVFDRGDLKYAVLRLLAGKPMHGYEVMQALEEESGGWYTASPGSVYPVLQMLQDQGHVKAREEEGGKRIYEITDAGRAFLAANSDRVDDVMDRVSDFASRFTQSGMGDVTRAFVKLAQTSFEEAVRRSGDAEAMQRIREILERAARDVQAERTRNGSGG